VFPILRIFSGMKGKEGSTYHFAGSLSGAVPDLEGSEGSKTVCPEGYIYIVFK